MPTLGIMADLSPASWLRRVMLNVLGRRELGGQGRDDAVAAPVRWPVTSHGRHTQSGMPV